MAKLLIPRLNDLGDDLTESSMARRSIAIAIPIVSVAAFFGFASAGLWAPAIGSVMAYTFFSYGSTSHDLVHGNLGFSPKQNAFWLSLIELLGLRSGHAYRAAHLHHHARFPHDDDIEGEAAHFSFWRTILSGPLHTYRIWLWAIKKARYFRALILIEVALCVLLFAASVAASRWTVIPVIYVSLAVAGSWLFPLMTAYIPHDPHGSDVLRQTQRFRGAISRIFFLDHLYHLEHHLYPRVPRHHWAQLARRLDPWLDERGVPAQRIGW